MTRSRTLSETARKRARRCRLASCPNIAIGGPTIGEWDKPLRLSILLAHCCLPRHTKIVLRTKCSSAAEFGQFRTLIPRPKQRSPTISGAKLGCPLTRYNRIHAI
jgi:hypothetical protein